MRRSRLGLAPLALAALGLLACSKSSPPREPGTRAVSPLPLAEALFDQSPAPDWSELGNAPRRSAEQGFRELQLGPTQAWILARPGLRQTRFAGLTFRFLAPKELGDFLEVRLESTDAAVFPRLRPGPADRVDSPDGWSEVFLPFERLDPKGLPFDRVVLRAHRELGGSWVGVAKVALADLGGQAPQPAPAAAPAGAPQAAREGSATVDCRAPGHPISPLIYGIAQRAGRDQADAHQWNLGPGARRFGGNPYSRYNWELGYAWNAGSDWFFKNLNYAGDNQYTYRRFLDANVTLKVSSALQVPMIGWVARDTRSSGFPAAVFGPQEKVEDGAGNGVSLKGKPLKSGPPTLTSIEAKPEFVERWVAAIRAEDKKRGQRSVQLYILDNEPALWHETHRDVHPEPVTYDELLERTVQYGTAIRRADPEAIIAGPAEWGWPNYFVSAKDYAEDPHMERRPDRRAHGDAELVPWYLKKLAEHAERTNERVLDVLDLHFYPQGKGLFDPGSPTHGRTDPASAALRIRSTRALWDPSYVDESWIGQPIQLIPRMRRWIDESYPGLGMMIGEYNFGADVHMSGGLAQAEALGRFGELGLLAAFFYHYPEKDSPAYWAFRAFRNYDGKGSRFLDVSLPAKAAAADGSLFASRDAAGRRVVVVLLNFHPQQAQRATVVFEGCAALRAPKAFGYVGDRRGLFEAPVEQAAPDTLRLTLPPYSISVVEAALAAP